MTATLHIPTPAAAPAPAAARVLPFPLARVSVAPRRRPRLLVAAARAGQAAWRRERDLPRLLAKALPAPGAAAPRLAAEEARLDEARRARAADYVLERHVAVLIALLAELRARRMAPDGLAVSAL